MILGSTRTGTLLSMACASAPKADQQTDCHDGISGHGDNTGPFRWGRDTDTKSGWAMWLVQANPRYRAHSRLAEQAPWTMENGVTVVNRIYAALSAGGLRAGYEKTAKPRRVSSGRLVPWSSAVRTGTSRLMTRICSWTGIANDTWFEYGLECIGTDRTSSQFYAGSRQWRTVS